MRTILSFLIIIASTVAGIWAFLNFELYKFFMITINFDMTKLRNFVFVLIVYLSVFLYSCLIGCFLKKVSSKLDDMFEGAFVEPYVGFAIFFLINGFYFCSTHPEESFGFLNWMPTFLEWFFSGILFSFIFAMCSIIGTVFTLGFYLLMFMLSLASWNWSQWKW